MAYDEGLTIPPLTVRAAANRLGLSTWAVHKAIERGELRPVTRNPIRVSADDVEGMRLRKQDEAIDRIGADRLVKTARSVRGMLHPPFGSGAPGGHAALGRLSETVKAAFTMPLLHAAAMPDGSGCRWCHAENAAHMLSVPVRSQTLSSEFGFALLGGPECERHRGLVRDRMEQLRARVHPAAPPPPAARTGPVAASAPSPSAVSRSRSAQQADDNGKAMVQRRLRETRARLVAARRSGDTRYALKLRAMVASLEADAAVVDGRVTAAARPGTLRCGHQLAAACACPRRASSRGQR